MSIPASAPLGGKQSCVRQWSVALQHLQAAIRILDESEAPPHVGAEIDLAVNRLRDVMANASEHDA